MILFRKGALAALLATTAIATAAFAQDKAPSAPPAPAAAPAGADKPVIGKWGFDEAGMDRSVEPGDNMYKYANGTWAKNTPIPADKSNYGMFAMLIDRSDERTKLIIDEAGKSAGSKIGDLYASYMDRAAVEAAGYKPIQPMLAAIDGARTKSELMAVAGKLARTGVTTYLGGFVRVDDKNPKTNIYSVFQGGTGLPDRDYYLSSDAGLTAKRDAYKTYITDLYGMTGMTDGVARAAAVLAFETRIAQVQGTQTDARDSSKSYNIWTRADFDAKAPGIDWAVYLGALGANTVPRFRIYQPAAITGISKIVADTPLAVLKDHLKFQTIDNFAPYLANAFVTRNFAFQGTVLNGTPQIAAEWKRGVNLVTGAMGEEVGKVYVQRYYPPEAEAAMNGLIKNVLAALGNRIQNLTWMSAPTKQRAAAKLALFNPRIGHPKKFRDYSALEIKRDDLVGNVVRASEFEYNRQLAKLSKPLDIDEWQMLPMTVNAQANFEINGITFPAAILQPPFFDPKADPAVNYGGIGAVIAHEISHHFDDQGSKYDETGALKDWWSPEDVKKFNALTDQLVAQFNKYEIFPGKFVNGRFTLGDNIGDLAGLQIAYDAYRASLGGKEAPVIDGLTGDQRFFLGWAQVWRRNYRDANLLNRLITDPHAPSEQRVAVMRNLDAWYDAFKVKPDDTLYLAPDQRVRIW